MADVSTVPQKDRAEQARPEASRGGVHFVPHVDIYETEQELLLLADVPSVRPTRKALRPRGSQGLVDARRRAGVSGSRSTSFLPSFNAATGRAPWIG